MLYNPPTLHHGMPGSPAYCTRDILSGNVLWPCLFNVIAAKEARSRGCDRRMVSTAGASDVYNSLKGEMASGETQHTQV